MTTANVDRLLSPTVCSCTNGLTPTVCPCKSLATTTGRIGSGLFGKMSFTFSLFMLGEFVFARSTNTFKSASFIITRGSVLNEYNLGASGRLSAATLAGERMKTGAFLLTSAESALRNELHPDSSSANNSIFARFTLVFTPQPFVFRFFAFTFWL